MRTTAIEQTSRVLREDNRWSKWQQFKKHDKKGEQVVKTTKVNKA